MNTLIAVLVKLARGGGFLLRTVIRVLELIQCGMGLNGTMQRELTIELRRTR